MWVKCPSSNARVGIFAGPTNFQWQWTDTRANLLRAGSVLDSAALDKYSFTRDAYLQLEADVAARWPQLRFRLAQSVERKLQDNLSWKDASAGQLQTQVTAWQPELSAAGIGGIDWQDWQNYPR